MVMPIVPRPTRKFDPSALGITGFEKSFGGSTKRLTLTANVPKQVLPENPWRASFTIKNEDTTDAVARYGGDGSLVTATGSQGGHVIGANGGVETDDEWIGEVWVVSTAGITIEVTETIRVPVNEV